MELLFFREFYVLDLQYSRDGLRPCKIVEELLKESKDPAIFNNTLRVLKHLLVRPSMQLVDSGVVI